MAHTHFPKGKTIWLKLKNGEEYEGKFIERKGKFFILSCGKFVTQDLKSAGYRRLKTN